MILISPVSATRSLSETLGSGGSKSASAQSKRPKIISSCQLCEIIKPRFFISYELAEKISRLQVMKQQESTTYKPIRYLEQTAITSDDRRAMCQWGYKMVKNGLKKDRVLAQIAIRYFDRFMSKRGSGIVEMCLASQGYFQLAFLVSSWYLIVELE